MPLCQVDGLATERHAWPKLWKHHGAEREADRVTSVAASRKEPWLSRYGGRISSEWLLPKALEIAEHAPRVYSAADRIVEGADWVVWSLTGSLARNACAAGYKGNWHKQDGFPTRRIPARTASWLRGSLHRQASPARSFRRALRWNADARVGIAAWTVSRTAVAAPIIDAHAAVIGGGVAAPGTFVMMMGTSTCHLLMAEREAAVEGMAGVVEDGIVPGFYAYESGQAAVGDLFAWFAHHAVPPAYHAAAAEQGQSLQTLLTSKAKGWDRGAAV